MFSHVTALTWPSWKSHKDKCFLLWLGSHFIFGPRAPILLLIPQCTNKCWWIYFYCMTSFLYWRGWIRHQISNSCVRARWKNVEDSRWGEERGMRRGIDGVNGSQRMMRRGGRWGVRRFKGHAHECGESRSDCNKVRQRRCVQKTEAVGGKRKGGVEREKQETLWEEETGKQEIAGLIVLTCVSAYQMVPSAISQHQLIDMKKKKRNMCADGKVRGYEVWLDRIQKEGGLTHSVLLCTRPLAPALSVSSVDPWTCHLDSPTNHIKVSSPGIHQAKWILDPGAADRPDGEKALCNPTLLWSDMIYPSPLLPPSLPPSVPFITDGQWFWWGVDYKGTDWYLNKGIMLL